MYLTCQVCDVDDDDDDNYDGDDRIKLEQRNVK